MARDFSEALEDLFNMDGDMIGLARSVEQRCSS